MSAFAVAEGDLRNTLSDVNSALSDLGTVELKLNRQSQELRRVHQEICDLYKSLGFQRSSRGYPERDTRSRSGSQQDTRSAASRGGKGAVTQSSRQTPQRSRCSTQVSLGKTDLPEMSISTRIEPAPEEIWKNYEQCVLPVIRSLFTRFRDKVKAILAMQDIGSAHSSAGSSGVMSENDLALKRRIARSTTLLFSAVMKDHLNGCEAARKGQRPVSVSVASTGTSGKQSGGG